MRLQLERLLCHGQCTIERLVATDETSGMDEDASRNARHLVQLLVADALPCVWQIFAVLKATILFADGTDAPLALGLVFWEQYIQDLWGNALWNGDLFLETVEVVGPGHALRKDQDAALGIILESVVIGLLDLVTRREPGVGTVRELKKELLADELRGLGEAHVLFSLLCLWRLGLVGGWGTGPVVVAVDNTGDAESTILELLLQPRLLKVLGRKGIDAVVVCVKGLNEVRVQLLEQNVPVVALQPSYGGDDVLAKVQVDEPRRGELGAVAGEGGVEAALVVVVALGAVIVLAADIDDGVALGQHGGVAGADELGVEVGGQETQHGDRERLVGVEVATDMSVGRQLSERQRSYLCVPITGASTLSFLAGFSVAIVRLGVAREYAVAGRIVLQLRAAGRIASGRSLNIQLRGGPRKSLGSDA